MQNKKTFYITTPIYYPSGKLHIGHAYTTTLAWTIRNYKTLRGYDAKLLTGADEHGQKIQQKAEAANISEQKYVDGMTELFKNLWNELGIDYDYYSRTTRPSHEASVQKIFSELLENDVIYKGAYKGLYSVQDEEFFTVTQAEEKDGEYFHPTSGHKLEEVEEESYFLRMSKFADWLDEEFNKVNFVRPDKIIKELRENFLKKGLEDLSITRTSFTWGVPVLEDPKHVVYVWLDALTNYINTLGYKTEDDSDYQKYWVNGDEKVHLVGKEITRFHCIYWPIILKALNLPQPTSILSHGWIITPEGKMSKSKGNVIDPLELIEEFGAETLKFFFASQISMGQDGVFDKEMLKNTYNSALANNYGNLLSRTIAMTLQSFDKPIQFTETENEFDKEIIEEILASTEKFTKHFDNFAINKAFEVATKLSKSLNGYIDKTQPWTLKEDKERLAQVLNILLNGIYAVSTYLSVVIPNKTSLAMEQLQVESLSLEEISNFKKFDEIMVKKGEVLFQRIK
ncbi:methionine--tRNA ligase [Mycoplasma todarodis]|uniref:Methionine--tRNA ligase n=1 Tax=Mycoplasma todarodis TaxID=1937191 RepID=A0A4R0XPP0_9MOLU|nr:methionine--tRNA ligase [Mycoplasma todarodis]TCG11512.1 methionine--tRNA ligase [Mycoplasma todarodis]